MSPMMPLSLILMLTFFTTSCSTSLNRILKPSSEPSGILLYIQVRAKVAIAPVSVNHGWWEVGETTITQQYEQLTFTVCLLRSNYIISFILQDNL